MASALIELSDLISASVRIIDRRCNTLSKAFPSLNDLPKDEHEDSIRTDPEIANAISVVVAAAHQLVAAVQMPVQTLVDCSLQFLFTAALGVANETNIAEILREAGPEGSHVNEIAKKNGVDPLLISRILRPLATHHIYREVAPDVFAHNRISVCMDTGEDSDLVLKEPMKKYKGNVGVAALMGLNTDETLKAAAYMPDMILDHIASKNKNHKTALNRAMNTENDYFAWLEQSGNESRFQRFGMAMQATLKLSPPAAILEGFPWKTLPSGGVVVDVGGGIGSVSMEIAAKFPNLHIVLQDRPNTLKQAENAWKRQLPVAISENRVTFEGQDFFEPQPQREVAVFILRYITHDWTDDLVLRILRQLRNAAQASTKLLVVDYVVPYACRTERDPLFAPPAAPEPLLANMGAARHLTYLMDLQASNMISLTGGQERTLDHFRVLFSQAGWRLDAVYRPNYQEQLVAAPV